MTQKRFCAACNQIITNVDALLIIQTQKRFNVTYNPRLNNVSVLYIIED